MSSGVKHTLNTCKVPTSSLSTKKTKQLTNKPMKTFSPIYTRQEKASPSGSETSSTRGSASLKIVPSGLPSSPWPAHGTACTAHTWGAVASLTPDSCGFAWGLGDQPVPSQESSVVFSNVPVSQRLCPWSFSLQSSQPPSSILSFL